MITYTAEHLLHQESNKEQEGRINKELEREINASIPPTDKAYQTAWDIENQKQWNKLADLYR